MEEKKREGNIMNGFICVMSAGIIGLFGRLGAFDGAEENGGKKGGRRRRRKGIG